ncbi:MAG: 50S ribosomal protein L13 [Methanoregula sp.]|jgi:large subunit ribosomal protein L13|nr:50S ribosomal protein L13 [Methanoregula sp.]MDD5023582.1 50S ribosomal protein L13 [Methanoregula sp.]MDD5186750.1 50S ribosomal protein L13 [Methanoregula sp.]
MVTVINGDSLILGRLASIVAQRALAGEEIAIVNAEKAIISGSRERVLANYKHKRERGASGDRWGPFVPRRPDHLMKRTIRGMLPYKRPRGVDAMKRIRCYVGIPVGLVGKEMEVPEAAHMDRLNNPQYVTLAAVSTSLGAKF